MNAHKLHNAANKICTQIQTASSIEMPIPREIRWNVSASMMPLQVRACWSLSEDFLGLLMTFSGRRLTSTSSQVRATGYHSSRDARLAPEEVLFQRKGAPQRYQEKDVYFAHEDLPAEGRGILPDSDTLTATHNYVSQFFEVAGHGYRVLGQERNPRPAERSMDETALLAFGMLFEEASRDALGRNGDLVFTEASTEAETPEVDGAARTSGDMMLRGPNPKRRKIADT